jgi:glyoxalase family protein
MANIIKGIHHITAIASDPQGTVDFYTQVLGLRLVKKSVNQDDVQTYHLFLGDKIGAPGLDLTFFTFQPAMPGSRGAGLVTTISLAVAEKSLDFWLTRFEELGIEHEQLSELFGHQRLVFYDQDGQRLELVGVAQSELDAGTGEIWETSEIPAKHAIRYFYSARLTVRSLDRVEPILSQVFGYEFVEELEFVRMYQIADWHRARYLEIETKPFDEPGFNAAGTVHHIAFSVATEAEQKQLRQELLQIGLYPTEVIDRYYFKSVYFRTPAGILFEIATMEPGFTVDEPEATLGQHLALPPFLEERRSEIEAGLPSVRVE